VIRRVRALADHPALIGWFLADEPEGYGGDPEVLTRMRRAIDAADGRHPVFVSMARPEALSRYAPATGIAITDSYPVPYGPVDVVVPLLRASRETRRPFQWTFQSYATDVHRWPGTAPGPGRYPTLAEMRAMAWLGIVHGATGLWTYAYSYLNESPGGEWHWADLLTVAHELRRVQSVLEAPEPAGVRCTVTNGSILTGVRDVGGRRFAIAVHTGATPVRATLRVGGAGTGVATDYMDGRRLRISAGAVTDTWPGFGVRVYEVPRAALTR
jgi:hypothetical protein